MSLKDSMTHSTYQRTGIRGPARLRVNFDPYLARFKTPELHPYLKAAMLRAVLQALRSTER